MSGQRNHAGVNDFCQLFRTVKGARYQWHYEQATPERMAAYRAMGARVRQFRIDGEPQLFYHPDDLPLMDAAEAALSQQGEER